MKILFQKRLMLLLLVSWSTHLAAQLPFSITNDNVYDILTFLQDAYPEVPIPEDDFVNFVAAQPEGVIEITGLEVGEMTEENLSLSWEGPSDGTALEVELMNLESGAIDLFITDLTEISLSVPNGLYLFALHRSGNPFGTTYIVVDKNILAYIYNNLSDCACTTVQTTNVPIQISTSLSVPHSGAGSWANDGSSLYKYLIEVEGNVFTNAQNMVPYVAHFIVGHNADRTEFYFPPTFQGACGSNTTYHNFGPYCTIEDPGAFKSTINANNLLVELNVTNPSVKIKRCKLGPSYTPPVGFNDNSNEDIPFKGIVFPNPFTDEVKIQLPLLTESQAGVLRIVNSIGQVINGPIQITHSSFKEGTILLNTNAWPGGFYQLQFIKDTGEAYSQILIRQ